MAAGKVQKRHQPRRRRLREVRTRRKGVTDIRLALYHARHDDQVLLLIPSLPYNICV
jgi:hypothetical protein